MTYNTKTKRKRTNDKELSTKHYTTKIKITKLDIYVLVWTNDTFSAVAYNYYILPNSTHWHILICNTYILPNLPLKFKRLAIKNLWEEVNSKRQHRIAEICWGYLCPREIVIVLIKVHHLPNIRKVWRIYFQTYLLFFYRSS
jgi:hypothetical protein